VQGVERERAVRFTAAESNTFGVSGSVCVLTSSYVRLATECMALLQNLTSKMFASSSISHMTEKARWSVELRARRE
jgi:hypothetical protein